MELMMNLVRLFALFDGDNVLVEEYKSIYH